MHRLLCINAQITPQSAEARVAKIALRHEQLAKYRRLKFGTIPDVEFADHIGVNAGQVSRTLRDKAAPGTRFIAGVIEVFGIDCFADLFEVKPDDGDGEAA